MDQEAEYRTVVEELLNSRVSVDEFVASFMKIWREQRDSERAQKLDQKLQRLVDRIFTSCDVYSPEPLEDWEYNADQLRSEVALLAYVWRGLNAESS
jgi:hypothetical protein